MDYIIICPVQYIIKHNKWNNIHSLFKITIVVFPVKGCEELSSLQTKTNV